MQTEVTTFNEKKKIAPLSLPSLELDIKFERINTFSSVTSKKSSSSRKRAKIHLPPINKITKKDPKKEMVESLDMDLKTSDCYCRLYKLKKRREEIDLNQDIAKMRLNLKYKLDKENTEKKDILEKLEAKETEQRGENLVKEKEEILKKTKEQYQSIIKEINDLYKYIQDTKISIGLLDSKSEYIHRSINSLSLKNRPKSPVKSPNGPSGSPSREERRKNAEKINNLKVLSQIEENNKEKKEQKEDYMNKIKEAREKIEELKSKLPSIIKQMQKEKLVVKKTRRELSDYFHLLLYEGLDFRNEGLITIIKSIWSIGQNVDLSFMPSYLDNEAIDYLFTRARQTIEIAKIKKALEEAKQVVAIKFKDSLDCFRKKEILDHSKNIDNSTEEKKDSIFRTTLDPIPEIEEEKKKGKIITLNRLETSKSVEMPEIPEQFSASKDFMKKYTMKHNEENEEITLKNIKGRILQAKRLNPEVITDYNKIIEIEKYVKKLEENVNAMKIREIERISKEFIYNGYQEKYKACIETVISALCGEEGKNSQMILFYKQEKNHKNKLKKIQFYSTYEKEKALQSKNLCQNKKDN